MRPGRPLLREVLRSAAAVAVIVLLLAMPLAPAVAAATPEPAARSTLGSDTPVVDDGARASTDAMDADAFQAWTESAALSEVAGVLRAWAERTGGTPVAPPDAFEAYGHAPEQEQRAAWRVWVLAVSAERSRDVGGGLGLPGAGHVVPAWPASSQYAAAQEGDGSSDRPEEIAAQGLRGLWRLETHGYPREMIAADDNGATFLVTSAAVLRFDAPGADPAWMVKAGYVSSVQATDVNGDGTQDLVLRSISFDWNDDDHPSIIVLDGLTGDVLYEGMHGDDWVASWTLTDVNGDGSVDLLAQTYADRLVARTLTGETIYEIEAPDRIVASQGLLLFFVFAYYVPHISSIFADVNGDGVTDVAMMDYTMVWAFAFLVSEQAMTYTITALDGRDGTELWISTVRSSAGYGYVYPWLAGELTGDAAEDIVFLSYTFQFRGFVAYVYYYESALSFHDGATGRLLTEDGASAVAVFPLGVGAPLRSSQMDMSDVLDLDGDGRNEIVAAQFEQAFYDDVYSEGWQGGEYVVSVVGRSLPAVPMAPLDEVYRVEFSIEVGPDILIEDAVEDVDGDGVMELVLLSVGYTANGTKPWSRIYMIDAEAVELFEPGDVLLALETNPADGALYGWTIDDRWGPLDENGALVGDGMRMVLSTYPVLEHDITNDGVPDLLLRKTAGMHWVDGRSGGLLAAVDRPLTRWLHGVYAQPDGLYAIEEEYSSDSYLASRLASGEIIWQHSRDVVDGAWLREVADVTGDGQVDLVFYTYRGDDSYSVFDPYLGEPVWYITADGDGWYRSLIVADVDPGRAGHELLINHRDYRNNDYELALFVPEADEALWSRGVGEMRGIEDAAHGWIAVAREGEGAVVEVVDATTGETNATLVLPADSDVTEVILTDIGPRRGIEMAVSYVVANGDDNATQAVVLYDFLRATDLASYELMQPDFGSFTSVDCAGFIIFVECSEGEEYHYAQRSSSLEAEVGDWDRDGLTDFAAEEKGYPVVRASSDGRVLAAGPAEGRVVAATDLNGDGRKELGVAADSGQLRFFAYDANAPVLAESTVRAVEKVDKPTEATVEDADFFDADEQGFTPAAPVVALILALLGLLVVARRRL